MTCFIGIDGGGTTTRAVLADSHGACRAIRYADSSNIQHIGQDAFHDLIKTLLVNLHDEASTNTNDVAHLTGGFAGAARSSDKKAIETVFNSLGYKDEFSVVTDADIALAGAVPEGPGIILISGTGSIAYGRNTAGAAKRAGGWGYLLGDEGSGCVIGLEALRNALKSHDGRLPETLLTGIICRQFGLDEITSVVPAVYSGEISPAAIASLAPGVFEAAVSGDIVAKSIMDEAGASLAKLVVTLIERLGLDKPARLCLLGSIFSKSDVMRNTVLNRLQDEVFEVGPEFPPVVGAIVLAMQSAGIRISGTVRSNLKKIHI